MNHKLEKVTEYKWELLQGGWYVCEYPIDQEGWMLRTGPFKEQEDGVDWFRRELDKLIEEQP